MRFLMYDRVLAAEKGVRMLAQKDIALSEEFFPCHFPRQAIVPASLLIEAMAQVAGWLVNLSGDFRVSAIMSIVHGATFQQPVHPGDQLEIQASLLEMDKRAAWTSCRATSRSFEVASVQRIMFALYPLQTDAEVEHEIQRFAYFSGYSLDSIRGASISGS